MDIQKTEAFLTFLEKEKGERKPLIYKLLHQPETLTEKDLNVPGTLEIEDYNADIKTLPKGLNIEGNLRIWTDKFEYLPEDIKIGGRLVISSRELKRLPSPLQVGNSLHISSSDYLKELTGTEEVYGYCVISNCPLFTSLGPLKKVHRDLEIADCPKFKALPPNLTVGGNVVLRGSGFIEIPKGLSVGGDFVIGNTPLSRAYTDEEGKVHLYRIEDQLKANGCTIVGDVRLKEK